MILSSGKQQRLNRIFNSKDGRAVMVAADHGWMSDPTFNVIYLKRILKQVVDGGADGVLMSFGTAQRLGHLMRGKDSPALLIRADWMNLPRLGGANVSNVLPVNKFKKIAASQAKDALNMGASGITIYYFIGYSDEFEAINLEQAAIFAKECRKVGLPLIIEPMAVGSMITGVNIAETLIASARIAVEIGADALKIPYTEDVNSFKKLVDQAGVPVLVLGGARSKEPRDALELVDEALRAGASGTVFGRNVTKAKDPEKMVKDLVDLVHNGKSIDEIFGKKVEGFFRLAGISANCVGCELCELACVAEHTGHYGKVHSFIQIDSKPIKAKFPTHRVRVCTLCGLCVEACPEDALIINDKGRLELFPDKCTSCGLCIEACPFDVMYPDENGMPLFCDLCGGDPQCVRWCKYDAIELRPYKPKKGGKK